jgi:hypothetical protein
MQCCLIPKPDVLISSFTVTIKVAAAPAADPRLILLVLARQGAAAAAIHRHFATVAAKLFNVWPQNPAGVVIIRLER